MQKIETIILGKLFSDEEYMRKIIPFLKQEYFHDSSEKKLFKYIKQFIESYNSLPTSEAIMIAIQNDRNINEKEFKNISEKLTAIDETIEVNKNWLLTETEKFCKDKAVYNAIMQSIQIIDGEDKEHNQDGIPSILQEALSVCFDNNVGHDYLDNSDSRYEFYHRDETKLPFDLDMFNKITDGGLPNKTLNIALAGTGVGKSLFMCHMAAGVLSQGKNVLYITLEMAEERIAERIDANLMNVNIQDLKDLSKSMFDNRIDKIRQRTEGKLIIKEYPTASAHAGHFKALLNELSLKRNFAPDIIFIDYLNICASSRFRAGAGVNSYTYVKAIAEELRGLAVEADLPIVSATQTTRGGYANSDVDLTDTSESFGLPATADLMFALISTEELEQMGQLMVKQLKNRYNDPGINKRFMVGIDRGKMKLFDLEASAQQGITDSGQEDLPVFERTPTGTRLRERELSKFDF
jgi:replicative DNA helicase